MLEKLNKDLKATVDEVKEIERQIKNLQAKRSTRKKKIENIKTEIQHLGGGQLNLFG